MPEGGPGALGGSAGHGGGRRPEEVVGGTDSDGAGGRKLESAGVVSQACSPSAGALYPRRLQPPPGRCFTLRQRPPLPPLTGSFLPPIFLPWLMLVIHTPPSPLCFLTPGARRAAEVGGNDSAPGVSLPQNFPMQLSLLHTSQSLEACHSHGYRKTLDLFHINTPSLVFRLPAQVRDTSGGGCERRGSLYTVRS